MKLSWNSNNKALFAASCEGPVRDTHAVTMRVVSKEQAGNVDISEAGSIYRRDN
jgi:hypothetical protein